VKVKVGMTMLGEGATKDILSVPPNASKYVKKFYKKVFVLKIFCVSRSLERVFALADCV